MDIEKLKDVISKKEAELKGMYDELERMNETSLENNRDKSGIIYTADYTGVDIESIRKSMCQSTDFLFNKLANKE